MNISNTRFVSHNFHVYLHIQTALNDIVGFFGSRRSHKCVNVSIEQLANKYGVFECQSMSVMTLVWARSECINVGSPDRHVTTSINWLVAIAQYSCDSSQIAHSAAVISCFELRWYFLMNCSSLSWSWSSFCNAKCRLSSTKKTGLFQWENEYWRFWWKTIIYEPSG